MNHGTRGRHRFFRSFVIIVFGPLVGALVVLAYVVLASFIDGSPPPADDLGYVIGVGFALVISFGWVAGLLPAILSAILWHFIAPRFMGWLHVLVALAIGALTSMAAGWPILAVYFQAAQITPQGLAMLAFVGSLAMAATALPCKKSA
ncbi:hypothetical protein N8D56_27200 (plasmid) [Devosia sp. A8/3-2]|nr:hypothetical protein N8D56_27200 [Devosia sp. A8/3-2]